MNNLRKVGFYLFVNMKIKTLVSIVVIAIIAFKLAKRTGHCFYIERDFKSSICYESWDYLSSIEGEKLAFERFVRSIGNSKNSLDTAVSLSDEMKKRYPDSAETAIRKNFSWVDLESLRYIIKGEDYSAILLQKEIDDFYVLYYHSNTSSIYLSFDTEEKYLPIDDGWVNKKYSSGLWVKSIMPWDYLKSDQCVFRRESIVLYAETVTNGETPGCRLSDYDVLKQDGDIFSLRHIYVGNESASFTRDTMSFIRWLIHSE